jgi:uncharacterized membrane protein YdjX (TVP38/TMEM64 family)
MENKLSLPDIIGYLIIGLLLAAIIALCAIYWTDIMNIIRSPESIQAWLEGFGPWAPAVFIAAQFLQVVVFVIPGEVTQLAGGFLFGIGWGLVYSVIGIGLGSTFAFLVARKLGLAFVTRLFGATQVAKFEAFLSSSKALVAFFLLFVIPGIPKDILCYVAGLSYLPLPLFLAVSLVGRLPALVGSVIIGHAAANQDWIILVAVAVIASVLFVLGLVFRKQIHDRIESITRRHTPPGGAAPGNGPEDYREDD